MTCAGVHHRHAPSAALHGLQNGEIGNVRTHVALIWAYDYQNRRVRKIVEEYGGSSWSETLDRKFVWYNWLLLAELDGEDDSVVKKYTWGPDLAGQHGQPGSLESAGGIGGLLATRDEVLGKSYAHFYDANGNTGQLILRGDGSTAAAYAYDAYGNVTAQTGSYADDNAWRFSTKWWDDETGLGYWGERYYDSGDGRWANRDPVREIGAVLARRRVGWFVRETADVHAFRYGANSPGTYIDAIGLQSTQPTPPTTQPGPDCNGCHGRVARAWWSDDVQDFLSTFPPGCQPVPPTCAPNPESFDGFTDGNNHITVSCDFGTTASEADLIALLLHEAVHVLQNCKNVPPSTTAQRCIRREAAAYAKSCAHTIGCGNPGGLGECCRRGVPRSCRHLNVPLDPTLVQRHCSSAIQHECSCDK
jgi:RHS repeat-associated protein